MLRVKLQREHFQRQLPKIRKSLGKEVILERKLWVMLKLQSRSWKMEEGALLSLNKDRLKWLKQKKNHLLSGLFSLKDLLRKKIKTWLKNYNRSKNRLKKRAYWRRGKVNLLISKNKLRKIWWPLLLIKSNRKNKVFWSHKEMRNKLWKKI